MLGKRAGEEGRGKEGGRGSLVWFGYRCRLAKKEGGGGVLPEQKKKSGEV